MVEIPSETEICSLNGSKSSYSNITNAKWLDSLVCWNASNNSNSKLRANTIQILIPHILEN